MDINITDEGIVFCEGLTCDPVGLWRINQHCGSCQFIKMAKRFCELWVDHLIEPEYKGDGSESKAL